MQFTKLIWRDGQPYSDIYDDIYFSPAADEAIPGESEFNHVFFKNNGLPQRWQRSDDFVIAELGLGSALNCILTIRQWLKHCDELKKKKTLHYIAIEKHPLSAEDISRLISRYPELKPYCDELVDNYPPAIEATHSRSLFDNRVVMHYKFMDVHDALDDELLEVDAWYLDGFSPAKNPEMWSDKLFSRIAKNSRSGATCSTYTAAGFVKRNLQQAGFIVNKVRGHGKKREMITAELPVEDSMVNKAEIFRYRDRPWFQLPTKKEVSEKTATIIGAGIAGLSVAHALVERGWKVTVIDRHGSIARETSSNPAPIVYPRLSVNNDIDTEFYTAAYCYALFMFEKLQKSSQQKFWFGDGLQQQMDEKRIQQIIEKFQYNSDFISIADNASGDKAVVEFGSAGVVLPGELCGVLANACAGSLMIVEAEVTGIDYDGKKWQCLNGKESIHDDEVLVIANGTDINGIGLQANFPVDMIRGQVAVLKEKGASPQIQKTLNAEVHITPVINGRHYLGATYNRNNTNQDATWEDNRAMLDDLDKLYPGIFIEEDCIDAWVGFRSMSKDRVPLVGAVPDAGFYEKEYADISNGNNTREYLPAGYCEGLYISAAHGSRGFTSCFISAEIITSLIESTPVPVSKRVLDYLNPSRFVVNDLKRR